MHKSDKKNNLFEDLSLFSMEFHATGLRRLVLRCKGFVDSKRDFVEI
jgi:hypothetical protein